MDSQGNEAPDAHHAGSHPRFLAHHYHSPKQQFDAGKLGMWIFLVTEILLFGGLFCWYAVYRANHPEIFLYASEEFLDRTLGAVNTAVLIFSSLTMAWGVRCAQLNQRRGLVACLSITLLCGFVFLGIKYVEYEHKWEDGLLWASRYAPKHHGHETDQPAPPSQETEERAEPTDLSTLDSQLSTLDGTVQSAANQGTIVSAGLEGRSRFRTEPKNVGVFFSIYFIMTGLHGIHVIAGMGVIAWILVRAIRGHFGSSYFGPVDYAGLYWHLVDMIWIYLFPLLYLID